MENQYNIEHAREILKPCVLLKPLGLPDSYLRVDEHGVWPTFEVNELAKEETEGLRWRPADHLQHLPDATEPASTPMLPNPFTARELAAFMLEGTGALVADFYGNWSDGPDQQSLERIDRQSYARRAVTEAFAAYREAEGIVGPYPRALQADADRARKAYNEANQRANEREGVSGAVPGTDDSTARRARAVASVAAQEAKMHTTIAASRQASEAWLTAMVVCLLEPQAAAPALVMVDSASSAPDWLLTKPKRFHGYTTPLYRLLAAAQREGKPCPSARDVVEAWRNNAHAEIAQVLPDGFDYYDAKGNTKAANLDAIHKAIRRMTNAR